MGSIRRFHYTEILRDIEIKTVEPYAKILAQRYGYLPYMVQRYIDMLGIDETRELLEAFETLKPYPTIRCNYLRIDCDELVKKLETMGFELEPLKWCSYCYRIVKQPTSPSIGATHEYLKGYYYVYRDAASTIPPLIQAPQAGDTVLDICAAPGGKATHLLQIMEDKGLLIANDKARSRIPILLSHIYRMGFQSIVVLVEDGRKLPSKLRIKFDSVLVDAPCSAEGGIMFDPKRKVKTTQEDLAKLVARELELLQAAVELTKPGGTIVYVTCSIAPEENEYVVSKVLELYRGRLIVEETSINLWSRALRSFRQHVFNPEVEKCIRIWPHRHALEGFFICKLRKML